MAGRQHGSIARCQEELLYWSQYILSDTVFTQLQLEYMHGTPKKMHRINEKLTCQNFQCLKPGRICIPFGEIICLWRHLQHLHFASLVPVRLCSIHMADPTQPHFHQGQKNLECTSKPKCRLMKTPTQSIGLLTNLSNQALSLAPPNWSNLNTCGASEQPFLRSSSCKSILTMRWAASSITKPIPTWSVPTPSSTRGT